MQILVSLCLAIFPISSCRSPVHCNSSSHLLVLLNTSLLSSYSDLAFKILKRNILSCFRSARNDDIYQQQHIRNKNPKVFDSSNSIYASAKMSGFKQQKHMNEQLTAWVRQKEVTPNAAGPADPSLFRLYLSRLCHQKHLYVCWFYAPSSSAHKPIAKEETERAALFQRVSPLLVSSIKPWRVTTFSCFHLQGIS